jgi:hypothetical protein
MLFYLKKDLRLELAVAIVLGGAILAQDFSMSAP